MDLKKIRKAIDRLDAQIVNLLNDRARLAVEVSHQKRRVNAPVFAPDRESQLLRRLGKLSRNGLLPLPALQAVYREIISSSVSLQTRLKIAYFGPEGSFTHEAARERFGSSAVLLPLRGITDVFREVERERVDYGVVPVENTTEGVVNHTLDMFVGSRNKICAEVSMRIVHNLLSRESTRTAVKKLFIHPQTLGQCRLWLESNLPDVEIVEALSNSKAAALAAKTKGSAAIASRLAAKLYGLGILEKGIEDQPDNTTRFLVLGRQWPGPTGHDKTSLMLAVKDRVGVLYRILKPFAAQHVNLSSIESRPSKVRAWNYIFFIDCFGHVQDPAVKRVLQVLRSLTSTLEVLGSYPRGEEL
jgi:chorismate mutase / prephenate dehydratase